MTRSRMSLLGGVTALALLAPAAAGDTTAPLYDHMTQRFTTARPAAAAGWSFDGSLKPIAAGTQVPPQRGVDFVFPAGTRIDPKAVPACAASDQELAAKGAAACPKRSRVGSGEAGLFLGPDSTITATLAVVAAPKGRLALVFTAANGAVLRVLRGTVKGSRITAAIPAMALPGGFEVAVVRFALKLDRAGTARRPLLRTPRTCPKSGRWTFSYLPRYDAPYGVQRSTSSMRCARR